MRWGQLPLLGIVALALAGCGAAPASGITPVSFRASAGTPSQEILEAGNLSLEATCADNGGVPLLSVGVRTRVEGAVISVVFNQRHAPPAGYHFFMADFDPDFGAWDFLGEGNERASGNLRYAAPSGGYVTVSFVADQGSGQGDCVFSGAAVWVD
jgi:hypothetical protein